MNVPLIVALVTFFAVVLASSAVFLYFNSREAVQTWRRRANGASAAAGSDATPAGMVDQLKAQLQDLLEWFARMNRPQICAEAVPSAFRPVRPAPSSNPMSSMPDSVSPT